MVRGVDLTSVRPIFLLHRETTLQLLLAREVSIVKSRPDGRFEKTRVYDKLTKLVHSEMITNFEEMLGGRRSI